MVVARDGGDVVVIVVVGMDVGSSVETTTLVVGVGIDDCLVAVVDGASVVSTGFAVGSAVVAAVIAVDEGA